MPCPTVTTTGDAQHADDATAMKTAIIIAREKARLVCKSVGEECEGVVYTPQHVELLKYKGEFDANNNPVFAVSVKCTFHCGRRPGCLFFWWPFFASTDTRTDDPEVAARLLKEEMESQAS